MTVSDYIPHGLIMALGGITGWLFRDHVKRDDARFDRLSEGLDRLVAGQQSQTEKIASNHIDVLKLLMSAAATAAAAAAAATAAAAAATAAATARDRR